MIVLRSHLRQSPGLVDQKLIQSWCACSFRRNQGGGKCSLLGRAPQGSDVHGVAAGSGHEAQVLGVEAPPQLPKRACRLLQRGIG